MFYSQTFLARKGPLSTVWIAAHLQHRLKKSHYTATDIPATVLRIMDPGVPIALRMSGHLLLGVVRIYSKKVEYLHQDCKDALAGLHKAIATLQLAPPEEARPAAFQSVTLPGTFDLDAQNIDDQIEYSGAEDLHMRDPEDITLTDRFPVTMDHYVTVSFDEDIMDSVHTVVLPDSGGTVPMEEGVIPQSPLTNVVGAEEHGPSAQRESPIIQHAGGSGPSVHPSQATQPDPFEILRRDATNDNNLVFQHTGGLSPSVLSPSQATQVEIGRDANNDDNVENTQVLSNLEGNDAEPIKGLDQTTNEEDHIPGMMHDLDSEGMSVPNPPSFHPPTPPTSQGGASDAQAHEEIHVSPYKILESPLIQQPQQRGRKRKQFFDEPIVLSNGFMRRALKNTRDILRNRKEVPSSSLRTWKLNNSRRKEHFFDQPLLTGIGKDLLDISESEYVRSRPHLVILEENHADARMDETLSPTNEPPEEPLASTNEPLEEPMGATSPVTAFDMGVEHAQNVAVTPPGPVTALEDMEVENAQNVGVTLPDVTAVDMQVERGRNVAFTPPATVQAHNVAEDDYMSADGRYNSTVPSPQDISVASLGTNIASERMQTRDLSVSSGAHGSETMQTPYSDAYHSINSDRTDEFWFLKLDSNTPATASSKGTSGSNKTLSERTKHTAQYFERLSSISPILEEPASDLSLNKILRGKTRHIAARMFFEVLVLKTNDLLDVQQEEPYGDISLQLAPTLSNVRS